MPGVPRFLNHTYSTTRAISPAKATTSTKYVPIKSITIAERSELLYVFEYAIKHPLIFVKEVENKTYL